MSIIDYKQEHIDKTEFFMKLLSIINFLEENKIEDKIIINDELSTLVKILANFINNKDKNTYGHTERVVMYSKIMAESLKLSKKDKEILIYGAYMHDIGKINTNSEILTKQTKLTEDEWNEIKRHPAEGAEMIKCVGALQEVVPLIRSHHERYDGKGYPNNLKGEEIPYLARVITVIDSFDAITSKRPYNDCKTYAEGIEELKRCSGTQFDPEIVKVFIEEFTNNISIFSMVNRKNIFKIRDCLKMKN